MGLRIIVRSRVKAPSGEWYTEWMDKTQSWQAAWQMVDDCGADRCECRKWKASKTTLFLDIGGQLELEEMKLETTDDPFRSSTKTVQFAQRSVYG